MVLTHLPTEDVRDEEGNLLILGVKKPGKLGSLLFGSPKDHMIEVDFIQHLIAFTAKYPEIQFEVVLSVKDRYHSIVTKYANQQE